MSRFVAIALAALLVLGTAGQADAKKNTAAKIGLGVAVGVGAALLLNEAAKANTRDTCPGDSYRNSKGYCVKDREPVRYESNYEIIQKCKRFSRKCDDGERWACKKAADYCDRG